MRCIPHAETRATGGAPFPKKRPIAEGRTTVQDALEISEQTEIWPCGPGGGGSAAPEAERHNWSAGQAQRVFDSRLGLVTRQLARSPYLAGETFTAADISVTYALGLARRAGGVTLGQAEQAYLARVRGREAYRRAMETCQSTRAWAAKAGDL